MISQPSFQDILLRGNYDPYQNCKCSYPWEDVTETELSYELMAEDGIHYPQDPVDTGVNHCHSMQESTYGSRGYHGLRQPAMKRYDGCFYAEPGYE